MSVLFERLLKTKIITTQVQIQCGVEKSRRRLQKAVPDLQPYSETEHHHQPQTGGSAAGQPRRHPIPNEQAKPAQHLQVARQRPLAVEAITDEFALHTGRRQAAGPEEQEGYPGEKSGQGRKVHGEILYQNMMKMEYY
jgi:hypothetical protein